MSVIILAARQNNFSMYMKSIDLRQVVGLILEGCSLGKQNCLDIESQGSAHLVVNHG